MERVFRRFSSFSSSLESLESLQKTMSNENYVLMRHQVYRLSSGSCDHLVFPDNFNNPRVAFELNGFACHKDRTNKSGVGFCSRSFSIQDILGNQLYVVEAV